jgi:nucleoside-diphosphate-sugar epimerase
MVMGIAHVRLFLAGITKKPLHVSPFKIREITSRNWRVDNSKMVRELNFKPKYSLESGLKDALTEDKFI